MSDYSRLKYNVNAVPHNESILKAFPQLQTLGSWTSYKRQDPDKLFRYTILLYSNSPTTGKSPLIREITRLADRKDKAANLAGYIRDKNNNWPKFVQEIMNWENQSASHVIMDYLKYQNEMKWAQRVALEENFWENILLINIKLKVREELEESDGKKTIDSIISASQSTKKKLGEDNKKLMLDMDELDRELFVDDAKAKEMFNKLRGTSPERVAKRQLEFNV